MFSLIIVESPAKTKKIEQFVGKKYKCVASFGHICEFKNGLKSIDINNNFKPIFKIIPNKKKHVLKLKNFAKNAKEIILATDDDREGEGIAWHIAKILNLPIHSTKRIIFHEITKTALQRAIQNPTKINMNKVHAQQARQILDLLVGYTISPILWKNINKGLSAGRCQTPALRLIYDNQMEINKSSGEKVYTTVGIFFESQLQQTVDPPILLEFKLNYDYHKEEEMIEFLEQSVNHNHIFKCSKPKKTSKNQPQPFTTSILQQKASNEFHYSPKQTMKLAQKLYEKGFITYMRTDSKAYSKEFVKKAKKYIIDNFSSKHVHKTINLQFLRKVETKGEDDNLQEAHEAIRPTDINKENIETICSREKKLYYLIWRNTLESCMSPAEYLSITANLSSPKKPHYIHKTEQIQFPGWKAVAGYTKNNPIYENLLTIPTGTIFEHSKITAQVKLKKMIMHCTEAKLVQLLEKKGIGRPSTFSSLIDKIQNRGYVTKEDVKGKTIICKEFTLIGNIIEEEEIKKTFGNEKNKLILQPMGKIVIEFLIQSFNLLFDYDYTKNMERELDNISNGSKDWYLLCKECFDQMSILCKDIKDIPNKNMIKIDDTYTYYIGRYGPCVKYIEDGKTKYKSARKDLDFEKMQEGEYTIKDILEEEIYGYYKDKPIFIKNGKYGKYAFWNNKNFSLKNVKELNLENIIPLLNGKNSKIIRELNDEISIRRGKWGPYIFHKTPTMKKPSFYKLWFKNFHTMNNELLLDKICTHYNIVPFNF
ncbi:DNA topoisomerase [bacterium]|nr:DNA topoisomerase [bacterium]